MTCYISCSLTFAFLTAMLFIIFNFDNNSNHKFINLLDNKQKIIYNNIIKERRNIYICGYIIGFIIALLLLVYLKNIYFKNNISKNYFFIICFVFSIVFVFNYFFYILYPKSNYMIQHLNNSQQIDLWLKIYKSFQYRFHLGFIIGLIAILLFSNFYLSL